MIRFNVVGLMSGTSLDGLDVALCRFIYRDSRWSYEILKAKTYTYPQVLYHRLKDSQMMSALELVLLDRDWALFAAECVRDLGCGVANLVCSHGHTVFHRVSQGLTYQLGSGAVLAGELSKPVVCDFRRLDVALGGQGAPLVPGAEFELFGEYQACLNLGGIANITLIADRIAFDISPCNIILNYYARKIGYEYDSFGEIARSGTINTKLLEIWQQWSYYSRKPPKSLGWEDISIFFADGDEKELLATATEHIACQISYVINDYGVKTILVTGGGTFNSYLLERLKTKTKNCTIVIPDENIVNFKEALCFAFLGLKRYLGLPNTFATITGASKDSCGGVIYMI